MDVRCSNPLGYTKKCADLQVKREGMTEAAELIPSPVLQPNCNALPGALATSRHDRAVRAVFGGSARMANPMDYPLFVSRQLAAPAELSRYLQAWARTPLRFWPGTKVVTGVRCPRGHPRERALGPPRIARPELRFHRMGRFQVL